MIVDRSFIELPQGTFSYKGVNGEYSINIPTDVLAGSITEFTGGFTLERKFLKLGYNKFVAIGLRSLFLRDRVVSLLFKPGVSLIRDKLTVEPVNDLAGPHTFAKVVLFSMLLDKLYEEDRMLHDIIRYNDDGCHTLIPDNRINNSYFDWHVCDVDKLAKYMSNVLENDPETLENELDLLFATDLSKYQAIAYDEVTNAAADDPEAKPKTITVSEIRNKSKFPIRVVKDGDTITPRVYTSNVLNAIHLLEQIPARVSACTANIVNGHIDLKSAKCTAIDVFGKPVTQNISKYGLDALCYMLNAHSLNLKEHDYVTLTRLNETVEFVIGDAVKYKYFVPIADIFSESIIRS